MDFFLIILIGALFGSFANVCIYRIPLEKSVIGGRSYCPKCKKKIVWYDNFPILSYLIINGKCRKCKKSIPIQYPLVEFLNIIFFFIIYFLFSFSITSLLLMILTFTFITGQLLVWQHFVNLGQYASSNPANAFFYVLTALHGLHILGGLFFWAKVTRQLFKDNYNVTKIKQNVELCAIYWHFLLIVWFVLFGLMVAT